MTKAIILPKRNRIFSDGREYIEGEREYNMEEIWSNRTYVALALFSLLSTCVVF
jgi:hypothetical protein